jgi:pyruvate dehydrogenase E1 component
MFDRFDDIFETLGWRVLQLKYGKRQLEVFALPGGEEIREWIDAAGNAEFAALTFEGGRAWREQLHRDLSVRARALIDNFDDPSLHTLMTGLGGHCPDTLLEAYRMADDERPTLFIAYTIKGYGLPLQGHKDNHAGQMTSAQVDALRQNMGIAEGDEWAPFAGMDGDETLALQDFIARARPALRPPPSNRIVELPRTIEAPKNDETSTQAAFGRILVELTKASPRLAERIVTTSPDVTVSTNLGGFVNARGVFKRNDAPDIFRERKIPSAQKWAGASHGQHIELGIAENNLFLMLAALGLSHDLWGERLLPIGTVYDPFIARGLDALNYACYQDARFMLVATPSGVTLAPEGGAHQSVSTPLIGIGQPGLTYFEPAYADELAHIMRWGFEHMQAEDGGSVYLRLSTRPIDQLPRTLNEAEGRDVTAGAYWLREPAPSSALAIAYAGAVAPDVLSAVNQLTDRYPGLGVLAITSPDRLYHDWLSATQSVSAVSHIENLLQKLPPDAGMVTVLDGHPLTLSWLAQVQCNPVLPLGVSSFGQCGDVVSLYSHHRIDAYAIVEAAHRAANRRRGPRLNPSHFGN